MTEKEFDEMLLVQEKNDLHTVMSTESGRRVLWRLLSYCGIYRDPEGTSEEIFKQLGKRQAGLYLLGILTDADEEKVFDMMREAQVKKKEEEYERERIRNRESGNDEFDDGEFGENEFII